MTPQSEQPERLKLNEQQRMAVERLGQDVCVVAGPGSGKTRVLTERFHWLVREQQIPPERILTVTFTEKAAREIKSRVVKSLHDDTELRRQVERAYVSTIHGFCTRLLRENAIAAGVDVGFGVLDEAAGQRLRRESADRALDELFAERPGEVRRLMESVAVSSRQSDFAQDLAAALIDVHSALRASGDKRRRDIPPPARDPMAGLMDALRSATADASVWKTDLQRQSRDGILEWIADAGPVAEQGTTEDRLAVLARFHVNLQRVPRSLSADLRDLRDSAIPAVRSSLLTAYYGPLRDLLWQALERLDSLYRERKDALSSLDFADLEERTLALLEGSGSVRTRLEAQFDYILMDELQDTNPLQWRILDCIRRPDRFFGVGDINQSIYGFRHAEPEVFRTYEQGLSERGLAVDRLDTNYRSRGEILDAVGWIVRDEEGIVPMKLASGAEFPARSGASAEVLVAMGADRDEAQQREARWIAHRIREFAARGTPLKKIAVLGRKMRVLKPVAEALREVGIPSVTTGGQTLYETRESLDLLLALHALGNIRDEVSLAGVLRSPFVGCRDETLFRLKVLRPGLWEAIVAADTEPAGFDGEELERLRWFHHTWNDLRDRPSAAPDALLASLLDNSGYLAGLDAQGRANVELFLRRLRDRFHGTGRSLAEVAIEMGRLRHEAPEAEAPPAEASDAVQLMSVHASKGLEFAVVFVPGLDSEAANDVPPICRSPEYGIGVRWRDPKTGDSQGDVAFEAVREAETLKRKAEEWRLLYVAMTRAEDRLLLSWSSTEKGRGSDWTAAISRRLDLSRPIESGLDQIAEDPESGAQIQLLTVSADPEPMAAAVPSIRASEPSEIAAPAVDAQHDSAIAATHLGAFAECPRQYYLRHYLGFGDEVDVEAPEYLEPDDEPVRGGAAIGTQVHHLLAGLPVDGADEEAIRLADAARGTELGRRIERSSRRFHEYGFLVELEDVIVRGRIDVWFEEGSRLLIADYKTDRFDPEREPSRLEPYRLQLRLYALALGRLLGRTVDEAQLLFLRSGKSVEVDLSAESLEVVRDVVRSLKKAQDRVEFPLREGERCLRCAYAGGLCPGGRGGST